MQLAVLGSQDFRQRHQRLQLPLEAGPSGVLGSLRIVDPATEDDVLSLSLGASETFDLDVIGYDARDASIITGFTPTWDTSDAGVATVDSNGLVTGVGPGSCNITVAASYGGGSVVVDAAAVTVASPAAVAALIQSTSTLQVTTGQTGQFTVQPQDAGGNALTGRVVTAVSDDTGIATVSVSGYTVTVTSVAAGACGITATCEGIDGAGVAVDVTDASTDHPHEPAGATQRAHHTYTATSEDGWSSYPAFYQKTDWPGAPASPPNYLLYNKAIGAASYSSFDPGAIEKSLGAAYKKVYVDYHFKLNSTFQGHTSNTNKLGVFLVVEGIPMLFLNAHGNGSGALLARVVLQGAVRSLGGNDSSGSGTYGGSAFTIVRDHRIRWQLQIEINTYDAADGILRSWVQDLETGVEVQTVNKTAAAYIGAGTQVPTDSASGVEVARSNAIWGGTGGTITTTTQILVDDFYVSSYP